jgi:uracil-DNA glycosylase family 4
MTASLEYMEEILENVKKLLPGWQYAMLRRAAQPRAGGRASHRVHEPSTLEKIALVEISPRTLRELPDDELGAVWLRLNQWFENAKRRRQAVENYVNAALWAKREIERRGREVSENALTEAISALEEVHKARREQVRGKPGPIPKRLERLLEDCDDVTLVRDFVSVAGSAAVAENPDDIDVVIRAPYDAQAGSYGLDGSSLWVALRRFLAPDKDGPKMQLLGSPAGSFTDYVPVFDLVARRRAPEVVKVEAAPPQYKGRDRVIKESPPGACAGPQDAVVAFVGASPGKIEKARREPFVGLSGETFNDLYLKPLGLRRDQALLMNVVPEFLVDDRGRPREPVQKEIDDWKEWFDAEIREHRPKIIVALGKTASKALDGRAELTLPHPAAVRRFGNSGEVGRKLKRLAQLIKQAATIDTEDTRGQVAEKHWAENWTKMLPRSGKGRFSYQHHFRGLPEEEVKKTDAELMQGDHSIHGDLRLEGDDALWGFTLFLGATKNNRGEHDDRLIDWAEGENIQAVPKLAQPKDWLDVGFGKPFVVEPGGVGATSNLFAKFFGRDRGTYELGVVREHSVEIFLDGKYLKGRYLIVGAPLNGGRQWLIQKPKDQTPIAEQKDLADVIGELKRKGQPFLLWAKPGERPRLIDVQTGRETERKFAYDGTTKIVKANSDKRIVYGIVLDPYGSKGQPELDAHEDWPCPAAVESTAHRFQKGARVIKLQHRDKANATLLETWVEPYPSREDYLAAMSGNDHSIYRRPFGSDFIHSGSWGIAVELGPDEWEDYKDGKFNAFSPGGMGVKEPLQIWKLPKVTVKELRA